MEYLKKITGAVFFVDILGIGALTQNQLTLNDSDYVDWLSQYNIDFNNQHLSASILGEFRAVLNRLNKEFETITIAQLSDCAFFWSESITDIIVASNNFMTNAINQGILCRGGLSYGEIIETTQTYDLGRFIVGEAVSHSVKLEGLAKGSRILIDEEIPNQLWQQNKSFANKTQPMFQPFTNPLDYQTYDEYLWYLVPTLSEQVEDLRIADYNTRLILTKERLKLAAQIRHSPKFYWNSRSKHGQIQLTASVNFMARSELLYVNHKFDWSDAFLDRSFDILERLLEIIESSKEFTDMKKVSL